MTALIAFTLLACSSVKVSQGSEEAQDAGSEDVTSEGDGGTSEPDGGPPPVDDADAPEPGGDADGESPPSDGGGTVDDGATALPVDFVRFGHPATGAVVSGAIRVALEPVGTEELLVDLVEVTIDEAVVFEDVKLPTDFYLDTRGLDVSELTLAVVATVAGSEASDQITVTVDDPGFSIEEVSASTHTLADDELVTLTLVTSGPEAQVSADLSALDSGFDPASLTVTGGEGAWEIGYQVTADNERPDGLYPVTVNATVDGQVVAHDTLMVELVNQPRLAFQVAKGVYVGASLPTSSAGWLDQVPSIVSGSAHISSGTGAELQVDLSGLSTPEDIVGLVVGQEGQWGHYQVPLDASTGTVVISLDLASGLDEAATPSTLTAQLALRDIQGRVSPFVAHLMNVSVPGSGDLQVTLEFDENVDLDLHVVEPLPESGGGDVCAPSGGCELYYGNKACASGGTMVQDSNAACSIDGLNEELITWPAGQAPKGHYVVRVNFWQDCCSCGANYTVTVQRCGSVDVYEGHFLPDTSTGGDGLGAGSVVAEFDTCSCGRWVQGRARYRDPLFGVHGLGARTLSPARHAAVALYEVVGVPDGTGDADDLPDLLLQASTTDHGGHYTLLNSSEVGAELYVQLMSQTDVARSPHDLVVAASPELSQPYGARSEIFVSPDAEETLVLSDVDVEVVDDTLAGAFNVFDALVTGLDHLALKTGSALGPVRAHWTPGLDVPQTRYCSAAAFDAGVCEVQGALVIDGGDVDRDQWDDMVVLRSLFGLALDRLSRDESPAELADGTRRAPSLAWSAGVSTFLASELMGSQYFFDAAVRGGHQVHALQDLEAMDTPWASKTATGLMDGDVSDHLVSALLWDLADTGEDETSDGVQGTPRAIYDVLFSYFTMPLFNDRGAYGVDLVDFLDGWSCRGWKQQEAVEALTVGHHLFPYDFDGVATCTCGGGPSGSSACCPAGQVLDCDGGCSPAGWLGDGLCDDLLDCTMTMNDSGDCPCAEGRTPDCIGACAEVSLIGDGTCDDGGVLVADFACEDHDYDGGDCPVPCAAGEITSCDGECVPDTLGDGICDLALYCDLYDGDQGDCCPEDEVLNCIGGCTSSAWHGDGNCDTALDCEAALWDQGDCLPCGLDGYADCNEACVEESMLGDGTCHDGSVVMADLNCDAQGFDQGDCAPCPDGEIPACGGGCAPDSIADGTCDDAMNCYKNQADGGDCCPTGQVGNCSGGCTTASWLGDGHCDSALDCALTMNDMGDCGCLPGWAEDCNGGCADLALVGDGTCHEAGAPAADFNCGAHNFDDGDCAPCPEGELPACGGGCTPDTLGDGVCDAALDCVKNGEDLGDCCPAEELSTCDGGCYYDSALGGTYCNEEYNCVAKGFDLGACLDTPACGPAEIYGCAGLCGTANQVGDGVCDDGTGGSLDLNCGYHQWDGGDCPACPEGQIPSCLGGCVDASLLGNLACDEALDCPKHLDDMGDCCPSGKTLNCDGGCTTASWLQDNVCDSTLNCAQTGYDGGDCDCPLGAVSDCVGFCFSADLLGDGTCNAGAGPVAFVDFFCAAHDYDAGDCTPCDEGSISDCLGGCSPDTTGDGVCDEAMNCAKNGEDGGDCCPSGQIGNCTGGCTTATWLGDNFCDSALNCAETDWDDGDCP